MTESLPDPLAIFPLAGAVLLPGVRMPLNIFEPRYLTMVQDALAGDKVIGMIQPLNAGDHEAVPALFDVGCVGEIVKNQSTADGRILITLEGRQRFRLMSELSVATPYRQIRAEYQEFDADLTEAEQDVNQALLRLSIERFLDARSISFDWAKIEGMGTSNLVNLLMMLLSFSPAEKQLLLEAKDLQTRVDAIIMLIDMLSAGPANNQNSQLQ